MQARAKAHGTEYIFNPNKQPQTFSKKPTFPDIISISSENAQVNTPLALDRGQVPWRIIHATKCFSIMIFRHVHLSTYLMNANKTGSALPPSSKIH